MEVKITIEAPDLAASILKLAEAIASSPTPAPAPAAPVSPAPTAAAPVSPAPTAAAPVSPAPVTPAQTPAPTATPPAPTAGQTSAAPGNTPAPAYTLDQISRAGASLVDAGEMQQLLELLGRYSVQAVTQLKPEQYGAFAAELRGLGAKI